MSEKISSIITDFLLQKNVIREEEKEIYHYGYEMLIYSIEQIILFLSVGVIMKQIILTIIFLIVFISVRQYTGGYHAATRIGCTFATLLSYFAVLIAPKVLSYMEYSHVVFIICFVFCSVIFYFYVPVSHPDKPLTEGQKRENRKRNTVLFMVYMVISLLTYHKIRVVCCTILSTMTVIAVLIIIQKKKEENQNEKVCYQGNCRNW